MSTIFSPDAELAVIGALLIDDSKISDVVEIVSASDFHHPKHRRIFEAVVALFDASSPVDVITVSEKLGGGVSLADLTEIASGCSGTSNVASYASMVKNTSIKRQVVERANQVVTLIHENADLTATEAHQIACGAFFDIGEGIGSGSIVNAAESLKEFVADLDRRFTTKQLTRGLPTGNERMDEITGGYANGDLILIAARPSMGKSVYAIQTTLINLSVLGDKRGMFFSLEMAPKKIQEQLIANVGGIDRNKLKFPHMMTESDWPKLQAAAGLIKRSDIEIADTPGISVSELSAKAKREHSKRKLDYIVVDHIHLMSSNIENRVQQMAQISGGLKKLARELNIPVIGLAQLSRKLEDRQDKRPILSDLRDSGTLEQDADLIQFIYRDDYYNTSADNQNSGLILISTAKNRDGELGEVYFENCYRQAKLLPSNRIMMFNQQKSQTRRGYDL